MYLLHRKVILKEVFLTLMTLCKDCGLNWKLDKYVY